MIPSQMDSVVADTVQVPQKKSRNDVTTTVNYQSKDSIYFDLTNQKMYLYGEGSIDYGNISLTGERIEMDWVENTIQATYILDDSTGRKVGKPVFTEGGDSYETDDMIYNFKTKKALINGIITEQDGAYMHGARVKKNEKDEMYIRDAKYTTCDLEHPHYYIRATKLKVIPKDRVLSGWFNIYFGEIPTPIGFPFGMFPSPREKNSGIIFPGYGEDNNRGFFLRGAGYYFDISEYMDLKITGDLYTNGSYGLNGATTYKKRYRYNGNLAVRYNKTMSPQFEDNSFSKDVWVNWSHTPQSYGSSRFSASVSGGTTTYSANANNVGYDYTQSINAQFNSNISYSKTFQGTPFNMTVNARHSQNISTGVVNMTLPEISFNASRIQPFKNVGNMKNNALGKLGFTYRLSAKSEVTNSPVNLPGYVVNSNVASDEVINFNGENMDLLLSRAKMGARHQIPVSTSFNMLKYFTVSPSFNYTEVWYPQELGYEYNQELEGVEVDTVSGFSRAGWWSSGASMSTRLYGMYNFRSEKVKAIRHVMTPNVGFSYSPDFGDPAKGTYQEVQTSESGRTQVLSKYQGFAYGGPSLGESASVSLSLNNNIEMKVKSKVDSVEEYKKIKIFDNLSMSTSYNFLADSFNLSDFNWNARTSFFKGAVFVSLSGTIDPYIYVLDSIQETSRGDQVHQRQIDQFAWNNGKGIGQLTRTSMSVGFKLQPKGSKNNDKNPTGDPNANDPFSNNGFINEDEKFQAGNVDDFISYDPNMYVPWNVPWSLNVNYSLNYNKRGFEDYTITQTLNFSGSLSITDKTRMNFNSGYDLEAKEFTVTRLNVTRDLHCWNISFNWVPFGPRQSYYVRIAVNSAMLKDLKLDKRSQSTYTSF
ncbi:putative LPS assembly protein LptD [Reichenbachiella ulvae]|uniref:LPS assembly protein LptD n=1 Tax=Reichenbachiella ulvae TaxID=2980104 RepID=A0ABT3CNC2_9BACT|nr:putative LPS assembly protein LptD [Reichenbachiella ulvae]MCV9385176.1 putative LPS assembly protein LptD [Reichenbachiella ulvae]